MELSPQAPLSEGHADLLAAAREELARCLRLLSSCLPAVDFLQHLPAIEIADTYSPLPEQALFLKRSHQITLYTHGDLNRPALEILTILLHKAIHVANAYRWRVDCNCVSYHNQQFRVLAEDLGFVVRRGHSRYGWAETIPSAKLREIFHDLALRQEILRPFQGCALPPRRRITWHCGLPKLPDREEL